MCWNIKLGIRFQKDSALRVFVSDKSICSKLLESIPLTCVKIINALKEYIDSKCLCYTFKSIRKADPISRIRE